MRIVINGLFVIPNQVGGSETYLRGLIDGLSKVDARNEYILCLGSDAAATFRPPDNHWRILASPVRSARRPLRLSFEQLWLPMVAAKLGADLIHSAGYTAPLISTARRVVSILDMNYKRHPEDLSVVERCVYSILIPQVARQSQHVITLSGAAREDIVRWTSVAGSKITAIPLAPRAMWPGDPRDDHARIDAAGVVPPYILSVAAAYPHKNLMRLVQAFPLEDRTDQSVQLVIVGLKGRAEAPVHAVAKANGRSCRILGWVGDALLASLYRQALALAFPSLYEGFGLPILEAMSLGTPVLTSNFGAMTEVAGGAAELVDAYDADAIRHGLRRLAHNRRRREELRQLGLRRAAQFSWTRTAEDTLRVYGAAAGPSRQRPGRL